MEALVAPPAIASSREELQEVAAVEQIDTLESAAAGIFIKATFPEIRAEVASSKVAALASVGLVQWRGATRITASDLTNALYAARSVCGGAWQIFQGLPIDEFYKKKVKERDTESALQPPSSSRTSCKSRGMKCYGEYLRQEENQIR